MNNTGTNRKCHEKVYKANLLILPMLAGYDIICNWSMHRMVFNPCFLLKMAFDFSHCYSVLGIQIFASNTNPSYSLWSISFFYCCFHSYVLLIQVWKWCMKNFFIAFQNELMQFDIWRLYCANCFILILTNRIKRTGL